MIPVGELAPAGCWDVTMLRDLFSNRLYPTGLEFKLTEGYPNTDGAIVVVPGRYWFEHIDRLNEAIQRYRWVLLIRTGDEEDLFDIRRLEHPNLRCWVQTPRTDRDYGSARLFGVGYTPHFRDLHGLPSKGTDVFLWAQNTHPRRQQCFEALKDYPQAAVNPTEGFTQGIPPDTYAQMMKVAKIAPCPSGAFSPDSFRFWEALEAHCIPIADDVSPAYRSEGFWAKLLDGANVPVLRDYESLPGYIKDLLEGWPGNANRITAWWMRYKREMTLWLRADLEALGAL